MFCPKCGNSLIGNEEFCPKCGYKLSQAKKVMITEPFKQNNVLDSFVLKIKPTIKIVMNFINLHKKFFWGGISCLVILVVSFILFQKFYDFSKIQWDENAKDYEVEYTESGTLELAVLAYDRNDEPITDIDFEVTGGKANADGVFVEWILPEETGEFTIVAKTPSGKKISKKVTVIPALDLNDTTLNGVISEESDESVDDDNDGLMNTEEIELKLNPYSADSDHDGLLDSYEVKESLTNPLNQDSDNDGLNDGDELALGLNPLAEDSKNDGQKDGERFFTYQLNDEKNGITIDISGKGNLPSSTIDVFENSSFKEMKGLLSTVYNFSTKGTMTSATVKIPYSLEKINAKSLDENSLTLYYFNEKTKALEPVATTVDKTNQTITATINHFSKYLIGDANAVTEMKKTDLLFVIDNSISMYTEEQMIEAGYAYSTGTDGNDSEFKRLTLTNQLIDMFGNGYFFGVSEFAGSYSKIQEFTEDIEQAKEKVNSMRGYWHTSTSGTDIIEALEKGISDFNDNENKHYLMLLTDGKNTSGSLSSNRQKIISEAKEKKVSICIIGLGNDIDTEDLAMIADETGCMYYNAKDANALDEIYSTIASKINYNLVDVDSNGSVDGTVLADSGFLANRDGFSFDNFLSNKSPHGHCYGMALFAELYYTRSLPLSLDAIHKSTFFKPFEPANSYDLHGTYFETYQNLYDYEMTTEAMRFLFYERPNDYRDRIENDTLMIKQEYYDFLTEIGATFHEKNYEGDGYSKYQSGRVDLDSDKFLANTTKEENQLLNAIYRLFVLQVDDSRLSFSSEPDKTFDTLVEKLNQNIPIVIIIYNGHAINATKLIQDNEDANLFYIEVYDNNNPGKTRYIEMRRSKMNKIQFSYTAWTNDYSYTFRYDKDGDNVLDEITVQLSEPEVE